jgi:hypothetical protein
MEHSIVYHCFTLFYEDCTFHVVREATIQQVNGYKHLLLGKLRVESGFDMFK